MAPWEPQGPAEPGPAGGRMSVRMQNPALFYGFVGGGASHTHCLLGSSPFTPI